MKSILITLLLLISSIGFSQSDPTTVYLGQDENNYPIYENIRPFYSTSAKIALSIFSSAFTSITTYLIVENRKAKKKKRSQPYLQENVTI